MDGVPHLPFLNDEELKEDVLLRLFQRGQQGREDLFARGVVVAMGVLIDRKAPRLQVAQLGRAGGQRAAGGPATLRAALQRAAGLFQPGQAPVGPAGGPLEGDQQIQQPAEHRKD